MLLKDGATAARRARQPNRAAGGAVFLDPFDRIDQGPVSSVYWSRKGRKLRGKALLLGDQAIDVQRVADAEERLGGADGPTFRDSPSVHEGAVTTAQVDDPKSSHHAGQLKTAVEPGDAPGIERYAAFRSPPDRHSIFFDEVDVHPMSSEGWMDPQQVGLLVRHWLTLVHLVESIGVRG